MADNIYKALAEAQAEMTRAEKRANNPHFRKNYADLGSVQDACLDALRKHGFAVYQPTGEDERGMFVKTVFAHESGEALECRTPLVLEKQDMQKLGSAITYARRYGLMCMAGIAPEDDDATEAAKAPKRPASPPKAQPPADPENLDADTSGPPEPDEVTSLGAALDGAQGEEALIHTLERIFRRWGDPPWPKPLGAKSSAAMARLGLDGTATGVKVRARIAEQDSHTQKKGRAA